MLKKLLITGANGTLGSVCREKLKPIAETVRLGVREGSCEGAAHEEVVYCDLNDRAAVEAMVEGCDGIVHLGGQPHEAPWEPIRNANIDGMVCLYEAARKSSVTPRIIFASSSHTVGYHKQTDRLDANSLTRPDTLYGVSKVFGEALASMYYDKFGIETASIRIGSCFPEPTTHRTLATWLSYDDLIRLIERIFAVPRLGCPIIYGGSANEATLWDNREVSYIGWTPQDNAEAYRAKIEAEVDRPSANDIESVYHGGGFCSKRIHEG